MLKAILCKCNLFSANGVQRERSHVVAHNVFHFLYKSLFKWFCALPFFNVFSQAAVEHVPPLPRDGHVAWGVISRQRVLLAGRLELSFPTSFHFVWEVFFAVVSPFWKHFAPLLHLPTSAPFMLRQPLNFLHGWGKTERAQCKSPKMEMKILSDIWPETVLDFSWKKKEAF